MADINFTRSFNVTASSLGSYVIPGLTRNLFAGMDMTELKSWGKPNPLHLWPLSVVTLSPG